MTNEYGSRFEGLIHSGCVDDAAVFWMALFETLRHEENATRCTELAERLRRLFESLSVENTPTRTTADEVRDLILWKLASQVASHARPDNARNGSVLNGRELAMMALGDPDGRILEGALSIVRNAAPPK